MLHLLNIEIIIIKYLLSSVCDWQAVSSICKWLKLFIKIPFSSSSLSNKLSCVITYVSRTFVIPPMSVRTFQQHSTISSRNPLPQHNNKIIEFLNPICFLIPRNELFSSLQSIGKETRNLVAEVVGKGEGVGWFDYVSTLI